MLVANSTASPARDPGYSQAIGRVVADSEIEKRIPALQEESRAARHAAECKWLVASAVLDAYHNYEVDWLNRKIWVNPSDPKGSIRVHIPELLSRYRRDLGRLLGLERTPSTKPIVTGDPNVWSLNRFGSAAASYIHAASDFSSVFAQWCGDLYISGTAGLMPYWDGGVFGEDGESGEVMIRSIPAWELYPFPATSRDDQNLEGMIWSRVVSNEWIKQNIPEAVDQPTVSVTSPYQAIGGLFGMNTPTYDGQLLRYVFIKPSRRFPQGDQIIMVGDKIFRREGQLKFKIGKRRVLPIAIARYIPKPTGWWGEGMGYVVARLNKELNRMMSLLVRRALMKAHPGYMLVPMGACNLDDFKNQIGGIVQYRPSPLNPEKNRPEWLTYPPGTAETDVIVNRLDTYLGDVTAQHNASEGGNVGRITSASGVLSLVQQDMVSVEPTIRSIDAAMKKTFALAIEIGRSQWQREKSAVISGPAGGPPMSVAFDPKSVPTMDQIAVVTGLDLPLDKQGQFQFLNQLAAPPYKGGMPLINPAEYRRGLLAIGVNLPGVDLIDPDEAAAWQENLVLYGDGQTPGQIMDPDALNENPEVHLYTHKRFWGSPEVRFTAGPAVIAAAKDHIQKTTLLVPGASVPPPANFDTASDLIEDDEFSQELSAGMSANRNPESIPPEMIQSILGGLTGNQAA